MTTHITKTWFDGKNIVTQEIPVGEVYKREWVGLTDEDFQAICKNFRITHGGWVDMLVAQVEAKLKEKNT